jgi:hypothetical protein
VRNTASKYSYENTVNIANKIIWLNGTMFWPNLAIIRSLSKISIDADPQCRLGVVCVT